MAEKVEVLITATDEASGVLSKIGGIGKGLLGVGLGAVAAGAAAATTALTGIGAGLTYAVGEAMSAEETMAQLNAVLTSTGGAAGVTAEMAIQLADSLSSVTRFEDDAIIAGESMLLTFTNISSDVFPAATQAMLDMSQAMGQDIKSSAIQLGKALNDPVTGVSALTRVGVTFTEQQKELIKSLVETGDVAGAQKVILQELQKEFGGSAEAAGQTLSGQLDILKNTLGNVAEAIGGAVLPTLKDMAGRLVEFVQSDQFQDWVEKAADFLMNELPKAIQKASDFWSNQLQPAIEEFWPILRDDVLPALGEIVKFLGVILPPIVSAFGAGWKAQLWVLKEVKETIEAMIKPFQTLIDKVKDFAGKLAGLKIPDWLTPGSPTPLELGIRGITNALQGVDVQGFAGVAIIATMPFMSAGAIVSPINPISPGTLTSGGSVSNSVVVNIHAGLILSFADESDLEAKLKPMVLRWIS